VINDTPAADTGLPAPGGERTLPGLITQNLAANQRLEEEINRLRQERQSGHHLGQFMLIDADRVSASDWIVRAPSAFEDAAFADLKRSIELSGGNTEPIVLTRVSECYRIEQGHRRHRACWELGIPVRAVVYDRHPDPAETIWAAVQDHLHRVPVTEHEIGALLSRSLAQGLFPSQRRLAERIGLTHVQLTGLLDIARLPKVVVEAFRDPRTISVRHARRLHAAIAVDPDRVLAAAKRLAGPPIALESAEKVVRTLCVRSSRRRPNS
jgi:ParB family chromosome partitioning protein